MSRMTWYIVVCLIVLLAGCGGGSGINSTLRPGSTDEPTLTAAPVLSGGVEGKSTSSAWEAPAYETQLKVTATNTNNAKAQVSVIRFCIKYDPQEDHPLTMAEALDYLDPLAGSPPAGIDVAEFSFSRQGAQAAQAYLFTQFKGAEFTRDERYWVAALFADRRGRVSPVSEPQRFKMLPSYPLLAAPVLELEKHFTGVVLDLAGEPLGGAMVAYYHEGVFLEAGLTGADGQYLFTAQMSNPKDASSTAVGYAEGRGLAGGVTQYVLKATHPSYAGQEVAAWLEGEYKDYDIALSFREANQLPVALLDAEPESGTAPLSVCFDASGSHDPDGDGIVQYDYDWESDGVYDAVDAGAQAQHVYSAPGSYTCTVRVYDARGGSGSAGAAIEVFGDDIVYEEDFSDDPGFTPSQDIRFQDGDVIEWVNGTYRVFLHEYGPGGWKYAQTPEFPELEAGESYTVEYDLRYTLSSWGMGMSITTYHDTIPQHPDYTGFSYFYELRDQHSWPPFGTICAYTLIDGQFSGYSGTLDTATWYRVKLTTHGGAGTADLEVKVRDSGELFFTSNGFPFTPTEFNHMGFGAAVGNWDGSTAEMYVDNILIRRN